ncbi:MAG: DUF932 domain-containing protein [Desulfobacteraceae bacterium]|nr:MAG: DUF932 domain-containing protein [Desulfobacteraceae bacterium]
MIGKLLTHTGALRVSREDLRDIQTPVATPTWKPIGHSELIEALRQELGKRSLEVLEEAYAVQRKGALLFGVIDLRWRETNEFAAAIGLRTANDKTFSIQMAVGFRVLVCDNLAFSGDLIALKRKHTARLDLASEMVKALDRYQEGIVRLEAGIGRLKETSVPDAKAKEILFDVFERGILPVRFLKPVSATYFSSSPEATEAAPRTLWSLHNAVTRHIQHLPPAPAFQATTRLGRLFGLGSNPHSASLN